MYLLVCKLWYGTCPSGCFWNICQPKKLLNETDPSLLNSLSWKYKEKSRLFGITIMELFIFFMKLMLIFTCIPALWLIQKSISSKTSLQVFVYKHYQMRYILWAFNFYTKEQRMIFQSYFLFLIIITIISKHEHDDFACSSNTNPLNHTNSVHFGFFSTLIPLNGIHWSTTKTSRLV